MGKHSAGNQAVFWRTLFLSLLKWVAISILPISAIIGGWNWLSQRNSAGTPPADNPAIIETDGGPGAPLPGASPDQALPASQILNGAGNAEWLASAQKKLEDAGYEIVATSVASRRYEKTTVFYQEGNETGADDLARLVEASVREPAPANLDENIPLTLVIGGDFRP